MKIIPTWQPDSRASSHEKISLIPSLNRLANMGATCITCWHPGSGRIYQFEPKDDGWAEMPSSLDLDHISASLDGQIIQMTIETQYRDATNYKNTKDHIYEGILTSQDFNTILTALYMDFDGIIPHQIGMEDHQAANGWGVDFDKHDHPWHEVRGLEFSEPKSAGKKVSQLVWLCEDRIKNGWDSIAAIGYLQDKHAS